MSSLFASLRIIKWILIILITVYIFFVFIIPSSLTLLGYKVDASGVIIGKEAAEKRDVELCSRIIIYRSIFGPTRAGRMIECIREYAEITKDPSACEELMPSSYGSQCLYDAQANGDICSIDFRKEVSWKIGEDINDWKTASLTECQQGIEKSEEGRNCCYLLQMASDGNFNTDCARFVGQESHMNQCLALLAYKRGDANVCTEITDFNKRIICELQVKYKDE